MSSNIKCTDDLDDPTLCDGTIVGSANTSGTTSQTIASVATQTDNLIRISVDVIAKRSDSIGQAWGATMVGTFLNDGGTVGQIGTTSLNDIDSSLLLTTSAAFSISGTSIDIDVTGELGKTYEWRVAGYYVYT